MNASSIPIETHSLTGIQILFIGTLVISVISDFIKYLILISNGALEGRKSKSVLMKIAITDLIKYAILIGGYYLIKWVI